MKKLRPSSGCAVMLACTSVTPRTLKDVGARMKVLAPTFSVEHSNMMIRARKLEQAGYIAIVRGGYRLHITRTPAGTAELNRLQHGAPSTNPDRSWYVLVDDRQVGEAAPSPRAAAVNYYRCRILDGEHAHPASVEVAQAIIPTHAELVAGLTQGILDDLECAMSDVGGEHAEDACLAIRNTGDSLTDVMAEWLAYRLPKINFWQWTGMQTIHLADVAGELSTTQPT